MRLAIEHVTTHRFAGPVARGLQRLRLTPDSGRTQSVMAWDVVCEGAAPQCSYADENGNRVMLVAIEPGVSEVVLRAQGVVETRDEAGVFGRHLGYLPLWHYRSETPLTRAGEGVRTLIAGFAEARDADPLGMLHALSARVRERVVYATGHTDVATSAEAALGLGTGVCQDQAHVFIAAARALGVPARYVSGYLWCDGDDANQASHGWAETHVEGLGWVGFDLANAVCPDTRHVRLATGRDYTEAAPVKGLYVAEDPQDATDRVTSEALVRALL